MQGSARMFVSVPVEVTDTMRDAVRELTQIKNVRASREDQIHITLCFMGDVDTSRVPALKEALRDALSDSERFDLCIRGMGAFPNIRRPRVIWMGIENEHLAHLADAVRSAVRKARVGFDGKPFSPHVTVCRVQGPADVSRIAGRYADTEFSKFTVGSVHLMKSVLGPDGAKHSVVDTIPLRPAGGE